MTVEITIKQRNSDFDQSYADEYQFGKETPGNMKFHWQRAWIIDDVAQVAHLSNQQRELRITNGEEDEFIVSFKAFRICQCTMEDGNPIEVRISESLLENCIISTNESGTKTRCYFYLKDKSNFLQLSDFVYVSKAEVANYFNQPSQT